MSGPDFRDTVNPASHKKDSTLEMEHLDINAEPLNLAGLRNSVNLTQAQVAVALDIHQMNVGQFEQQKTDPRLSTLRDYVAALGGELNLVATFKDRPGVLLKGFD